MSNVKKVLLIAPPWIRFFGLDTPSPPLGLCYIGAVLEKSGYEVKMYNGDFARTGVGATSFSGMTGSYTAYLQDLHNEEHPIWKEVTKLVFDEKADIVGITCRTPTYGSALRVSEIVKKVDSTTPVVFGGVHPTTLPAETVQNETVDIVVRGEGEYTFLDLVRNLHNLEGVLGITWKDKRRVIHNADRPPIKNLDELPFPAKHLVHDVNHCPPEALGQIFASRGCPYRCVFCASHKVWSRVVRYRSPQNIVDEIQSLSRGVKSFSFEDDSFTLNKKLVFEVCDLLMERRLGVRWRCETRVDLTTRDLVKKMKQAGCEEIYLGLESGDEETLKRIKKGITTDQMRQAVAAIRDEGIYFSAFLMIGFPWETEESIKNTLSLMDELKPFRVTMSVTTPYPGTELYDICNAGGLLPANLSWETFFHQSPDMFLSSTMSGEEVSSVIRGAQEKADKYNRRRVMMLPFTNPGYVMRRMIKGKYWYPLRALKILRHLFK